MSEYLKLNVFLLSFYCLFFMTYGNSATPGTMTNCSKTVTWELSFGLHSANGGGRESPQPASWPVMLAHPDFRLDVVFVRQGGLGW